MKMYFLKNDFYISSTTFQITSTDIVSGHIMLSRSNGDILRCLVDVAGRIDYYTDTVIVITSPKLVLPS